ncbi:MAG: hypothetical protein ACE3L7_07425 [Candidatus Pristimantibacillus sp.]
MDNNITRNHIFYIIISEDTTEIGPSDSKAHLIYNPILVRRGELPQAHYITLNIALQYTFTQDTTLLAVIFTPQKQTLTEVDLYDFLTQHESIKNDFYRGVIILQSHEKIIFEQEGEYSVVIFSNDEPIFETFFVIEDEGDTNEQSS